MSRVVLVTAAAPGSQRRAYGPFATDDAAWDWADDRYPNERVQVLMIRPPEGVPTAAAVAAAAAELEWWTAAAVQAAAGPEAPAAKEGAATRLTYTRV